MARKKSVKAKEPVRIRFKSVSNGNKSIYLDIYQNGQRSYKFLKLYLVPETTETAKVQNANALQAANAIKSQMVIDIANNEAGIKTDATKSKMLLTDWLDIYQQDRLKKGKRIGAIVPNLKKIVTAYKDDKVTLQMVDKKYCMGLIDFMQNGYITQFGRKLSQSTAYGYCSAFSAILKNAVIAGAIPFNPFDKIPATDRIPAAETKRGYLTASELKRLIDTPFPDKGIIRTVNGQIWGGRNIKEAFLFSCFTGLRRSDVIDLKWGNIVEVGGQMQIDGLVMKKTGTPIYLPLNATAVSLLPDRNGAADGTLVFNMPTDGGNYINERLKVWAADAGVTKNVTFHVARHTFATLSLTAGADIFTVSKLLGHRDISTTQIYAKIVNSKKIEAVNMLDNLLK